MRPSELRALEEMRRAAMQAKIDRANAAADDLRKQLESQRSDNSLARLGFAFGGFVAGCAVTILFHW